jgi:hypothetical protein
MIAFKLYSWLLTVWYIRSTFRSVTTLHTLALSQAGAPPYLTFCELSSKQQCPTQHIQIFNTRTLCMFPTFSHLHTQLLQVSVGLTTMMVPEMSSYKSHLHTVCLHQFIAWY